MKGKPSCETDLTAPELAADEDEDEDEEDEEEEAMLDAAAAADDKTGERRRRPRASEAASLGLFGAGLNSSTFEKSRKRARKKQCCPAFHRLLSAVFCRAFRGDCDLERPYSYYSRQQSFFGVDLLHCKGAVALTLGQHSEPRWT